MRYKRPSRDKGRLGEGLQLRSAELNSLAHMGAVLSRIGDFAAKTAKVLEQLDEIAEADWVTLRDADAMGGGIRLVAAAGPAVSEFPPVPL